MPQTSYIRREGIVVHELLILPQFSYQVMARDNDIVGSHKRDQYKKIRFFVKSTSFPAFRIIPRFKSIKAPFHSRIFDCSSP